MEINVHVVNHRVDGWLVPCLIDLPSPSNLRLDSSTDLNGVSDTTEGLVDLIPKLSLL